MWLFGHVTCNQSCKTPKGSKNISPSSLHFQGINASRVYVMVKVSPRPLSFDVVGRIFNSGLPRIAQCVAFAFSLSSPPAPVVGKPMKILKASYIIHCKPVRVPIIFLPDSVSMTLVDDIEKGFFWKGMKGNDTGF